jgi:phosphoribosylformylglycinamidine synthase
MPQMVSRIEVATTVFDTRAAIRKKKFADFSFHKKIVHVFIVDAYTIDKSFTQKELEEIAQRLANPVTQQAYIHGKNTNPKQTFTFAIEIGFLPGVTDNIAHTVKEIASDVTKKDFIQGEDVYTSQITFIDGHVSEDEIRKIAESLYNPIIQRAHIKSYKTFLKDKGMDVLVPKVTLSTEYETQKVDLDVSDRELEILGKLGIKNADGTRRGPLALSLLYMKEIQKYFNHMGRKPTDIELESLAQTWAEHCKHTIFNDPLDELSNGLFKTYIKAATEYIRKEKGKEDFCISVFTDNSGAIALDENWLITHKVETHNSPSALDPFGGAITGIVGVNRDALGFGLGAKPVANTYGFCFANPNIVQPLYKGEHQTQQMLSARRIMDGVIDGVNAGGNQSGIPTPQGFIYFDERYRGKPLVFCGTVGLIPKEIQGKPSWIKKARKGDYIVMIGGRVGKDGIHGATFSSEAMDSKSPRTAVQIGDPITQKKLSDALVKEARNLLLYHSITDNGAGGLSCSVAEMARESNGCLVDLEKVPLKYEGLAPWEIWISESQERMTLAVPKDKWSEFFHLMKHRSVEATVIGEFTDSGKCIVRYNKKIIMDIHLAFLHNGLPKRHLKSENISKQQEEPHIPYEKKLDTTLIHMLQRQNIASFAFISQQYDHVVQATSVLTPLLGRGRVNAETSVLRPILSSQKGVVLSQGMYPSYSDVDTYKMAAASLDTAVRNVVSAGANPNYIALLDNFCWCSPLKPQRLKELKKAAKACYDYATYYGTPFISGKDSMYNDFHGFDKNGKKVTISIPPTLLISSIGVVDEITHVVSLDAKNPGDLLYILGETNDEMGASEYFSMKGEEKGKKYIGNIVPSVNQEQNKKLYQAFYRAVEKTLIASSISITRGGLGVAVTKKAIGGMLGITIDLKKLPGNPSRNDYALFSESQGRILVTIAKENKRVFEKSMEGNSIALVGKVVQKPSVVVHGLKGETIVNTSLTTLVKAYTKTFKGF